MDCLKTSLGFYVDAQISLPIQVQFKDKSLAQATNIVKKHYDDQLNIFIEKKKAEEKERTASEKAKEKREAEKMKVEEPRGARVEEITDEEAKRIMEKNKAAETKKTEEKPKKEEGAKSDDENEPPPLGNGGKTDKYTWTQTLSEVVITIPMPPETNKKTITVKLGSKKIKAEVKGQPPIIDGEFPEKIKVVFDCKLQPDDSFWTLEESRGEKVLCITVEKFEGMHWWDCAIAGDSKIDTKKIRPEDSKLSDLDPETRATVNKMMFDQQQKAKGEPTSDELQKKEMLKKFMEAHPEMDFSKAKIS